MPDTTAAMKAAIEADAAVQDAAELAERMRAIGAMGAAAAMELLARKRQERADRVWAMTDHALHAHAMAGRSSAFTARQRLLDIIP